MNHLRELIREVPDFPKPGINFYDITTLLKHPAGLKGTVDALAAEYDGMKVDVVIGVEARSRARLSSGRRLCPRAQTAQTSRRVRFSLLRS